MRLVRLAWLELTLPVAELDGIDFYHDEVLVKTGSSTEPNEPQWRLLLAEVPLESWPVEVDRLLRIPEDARVRAEEALAAVSDALSVLSGSQRKLLSPSGLAVAFAADNAQEKTWLASQSGIKGASVGVVRTAFSPRLDMSVLQHLSDREDGVALLAEALAQRHSAGRFRELLRIFERGFATSSNRLVPLLADFLKTRPALGYSKTEVKRWILRLRGPAVHADRHAAFMNSREVADVVDRMLLASYEVLLNKRFWRSQSSDRRDIWTPIYGPLDPHGLTTFGAAGEKGALAGHLFDQFGAFPVSASRPRFRLDNSYWPRRPTSMEWPQPLHVIDRAELEIG
jgi:hypothetical protein